MARYDYGLRGPRETMDPRFHDWSGRSYFGEPARRPPGPPSENRVTAAYNRDYVRPDRGESYPRNPVRYAGDRPRRIDSEYDYYPPYITRGGTWTHRGIPRPDRYDDRDYR